MDKEIKEKPPRAPIQSSSTSMISDFEILKKLGQGAHGTVFKVRRKIDNNTYVMKQICTQNMSIRQKKDILSEAFILNSLDSEHIVKYYDSFLEGNYLNIVMEYCDGGDLETYIRYQMNRPIAERKIWKYFIQMALGLKHLHDRKILHRDIKTLNVFLTSAENIRIGDLGVAKVLPENLNFAHAQVGTPFYMSPEICQDIPYNEKCDIWSLGVVLYELCAQKKPFESGTQTGLVSKILKAEYNPLPTFFSKELAGIVALCLTKDYKKRPSISELLSNKDVEQKAKNLGITLAQKHQKVASSSAIIIQPQVNSESIQQPQQNQSQNQQLQIQVLTKSPSPSPNKQPQQNSMQNIHLKSASENQSNQMKKDKNDSSKNLQLNQFLPHRSITKFQIIQEAGVNCNNIGKQQNFLLDKKYSQQLPQQQSSEKPSNINFKSLIYPPNYESQIDGLEIDEKKFNNSNNFNSGNFSPSKKSKLIEQINQCNQSNTEKSNLYSSSLSTPLNQFQPNSNNYFSRIEQMKQIKNIINGMTEKKPKTPAQLNKIDIKIEKPKYLSPLKKEENLYQRGNIIQKNKNFPEKNNTSPCHSPSIRKRIIPNVFGSSDTKDKKNVSMSQEMIKSKVSSYEEMQIYNQQRYTHQKSFTSIQQQSLQTLQQSQIVGVQNKENNQNDIFEFDSDTLINIDTIPEPLKDFYQQKKEKALLIQQNINSCVNQLGKECFQDIYSYLSKNIDSQDDNQKEDQSKVYQYMMDKLGKKNQMCIFNIYKIMHLQVDIKTLKEKIERAKRSIDQQQQQQQQNK